jgi:WhiB family transcriptional regulator, redox-sensing transcriptional regulator
MIGATWDLDRWRQEAACRNVDTALFFPEEPAEDGEAVLLDPIDLARAKANTAKALLVCASCPVREQCLEFAIATRQMDGIWGGLNADQRRSVRRRRMAATRRNTAVAQRRSA